MKLTVVVSGKAEGGGSWEVQFGPFPDRNAAEGWLRRYNFFEHRGMWYSRGGVTIRCAGRILKDDKAFASIGLIFTPGELSVFSS
jgi:hypothetical protein